MKFADKIKKARLEKGFSIEKLSSLTKISKKSLISYEELGSKPRKNNLRKLAETLNVSFTYLLNDDETDEQKNIVEDMFLAEAHDKFGSKGEREAKDVLHNVSTLFAGGNLNEDAKDVFYQALMMVYMDSKENARERFTPSKYKKNKTKK